MNWTQLRVTVKTGDIDRTAAIMSMLDNGIMIEADENGEPRYVEREPGFPTTGNHWPVTPECFYYGLKTSMSATRFPSM